MSEELARMSSPVFDKILDLFVADTEFRSAFALDPAGAVKAKGITLTPEEAVALSQLAPLCRKDGLANFDDRLVLCSSSGY
jgi:hypothetical protein